MKKKNAGIVLAIMVILAASLLIGAGGREVTAPQTSGASIVTPPGEFPIVKDKVTLKFFSPQAPTIEDLTTNSFTTEYEQKTNVHIDWEIVPSAGLAERRNLSLASGDYPDVYFASNLSLNDEALYGPAGVFIPLNSLLDKYSIWFNELRKEYPTIDEQIVALDGNIYTLPLARNTPHTMFQRKMWINETWEKNLGLSMPATTDDFYNTLTAFKTRDPNKNGKADEIPLIINTDATLSGLSFIMNAFIYDDSYNRLIIDDNNKISLAFMQDGWKDGLAYFHKLYTDGLLDKSSFTITDQQVKQLVESGSDLTIGAIPAQAPSGFADLSGTRHESFGAIAPLKGPKGVQFATWEPYNHITGTYAVTSKCKYPEVAVRWVDWLYSFDGALRAREGVEGVQWMRPAQGVLSYAGLQATWQRLEQYGTTQNYKYDGIQFPQNMTIHNQQTGTDDIYSAAGLETRLYRATLLMMPYAPKTATPPIRLSSADTMQFSQLQNDINTYWMESAVQFITGDMDLTADWNKYLSNLNALQIDRYIKYLQSSYDQFLANKK
ncbi:MAG: extracellular solute-binding protein [Treponema sp.]|nr:extracellular solute-binding protein [Treponema sp.]